MGDDNTARSEKVPPWKQKRPAREDCSEHQPADRQDRSKSNLSHVESTRSPLLPGDDLQKSWRVSGKDLKGDASQIREAARNDPSLDNQQDCGQPCEKARANDNIHDRDKPRKGITQASPCNLVVTPERHTARHRRGKGLSNCPHEASDRDLNRPCFHESVPQGMMCW